MKLLTFLIPLALSAVFATTGHAVEIGDHGAHQPLHGGIVTETKELDQELVVRPGSIRLYLRDHSGKPVTLGQASAKLTLLTGSEKQDIELKPAGDRLEATGNFKAGAGTKAVTVVTGASKSASTARFTLK